MTDHSRISADTQVPSVNVSTRVVTVSRIMLAISPLSTISNNLCWAHARTYKLLRGNAPLRANFCFERIFKRQIIGVGTNNMKTSVTILGTLKPCQNLGASMQ